MNFIKKIFDDKIDDSVHLQFQKFGKGEFENRAMIKAKKTKDKYTIFTTAEFANEMVRDVARKLGSERTRVTGAVVSTLNLEDDLEFKEKKQFQGVKRYMIDKEFSGEDILNLLDKFPKVFFGLSFEVPGGNTTLKIKPKAPKSGKPKTKGNEKPKPDFCKLITPDSEIGGGFIWEKDNFKEANLKHTFVIEDIVIPEELKGSEDFKRIREESRRKGKIIRQGTIDGEEVKKEKEFEA